MIKRFLIVFAIFILPLLASIESELKSMLKGKIENITTILDNKKYTKDDKEKKIISSIEDIFDFSLMAKLSLGGREWSKLSDKERDSYSELFIKRVKNSYFEKLHSYTNEKVEIKEPEKSKSTRISITSFIVGKSEPIKIVYKFYLSGDKKWLIYDLEIEEVSIVQTYRSQFAEILANSNFNELLKKLSN